MQQKENNIIKLIGWGPLIFIPLFVIVVIGFIMIEHEQNFNITLNKIEHNLIESEKKATKSKIDGISDLVTYQNNITVQKLTSRVKERVITAHTIATRLYEQYKNEKSNEEIKRLIKTTLRPLTWNNDESFIFILDFDGVFQLAPKYLQHLEDKSIINFKDAQGRYIIKEEIALVKNNKEGFLWDTFTKPSDPMEKQYEQVVFVKDLEYFNWYLGSGEYLDSSSKVTNEELLNAIKKVSVNTTNYIFVFDTEGNILLNESTPEYANKNFYKLDNEDIKNPYLNAIKELKNKKKSHLIYSWINPTTHKEEKKFSYFRKIENSNWIIGSGFYESTVKNQAAKQTVKVYEAYHSKINYILSIGVISILISLVFSYLISKYLKSSFIKYQKSITKKTAELVSLNRTLEEKVRKRTEELEKSKASLEILATTDTLTKVHNRYSIMKTLDNEMTRAKRHTEALCVLMYDLDKFKDVNDTFGHDVGDIILYQVTNIVENSLREIDIIGRYGGEEFLVILPNTTLEDALVVSQRVKINVENHVFDQVEHLTISLGLVSYNNQESSDELFKRLDDLLYSSKDNGRNQLSY